MIVIGKGKEQKGKVKEEVEEREPTAFEDIGKIDKVLEKDETGLERPNEGETKILEVEVEKVINKKHYFCFYRSGSTDNWKAGSVYNNDELAMKFVPSNMTDVYLAVVDLPIS